MPKLLFIPGSLRAASSARATVRTLAAAIAAEAEATVAEIGTLSGPRSNVVRSPIGARTGGALAMPVITIIPKASA